MLSEDGSISFVPELLDVLASALERYESVRGVVEDPLERGLVILYVLEALASEVHAISACLESAPPLRATEPRALLQQCLQAHPASEQAQREAIIAELARRGWRAEPPAC